MQVVNEAREQGGCKEKYTDVCCWEREDQGLKLTSKVILRESDEQPTLGLFLDTSS